MGKKQVNLVGELEWNPIWIEYLKMYWLTGAIGMNIMGKSSHTQTRFKTLQNASKKAKILFNDFE